MRRFNFILCFSFFLSALLLGRPEYDFLCPNAVDFDQCKPKQDSFEKAEFFFLSRSYANAYAQWSEIAAHCKTNQTSNDERICQLTNIALLTKKSPLFWIRFSSLKLDIEKQTKSWNFVDAQKYMARIYFYLPPSLGQDIRQAVVYWTLLNRVSPSCTSTGWLSLIHDELGNSKAHGEFEDDFAKCSNSTSEAIHFSQNLMSQTHTSLGYNAGDAFFARIETQIPIQATQNQRIILNATGSTSQNFSAHIGHETLFKGRAVFSPAVAISYLNHDTVQSKLNINSANNLTLFQGSTHFQYAIQNKTNLTLKTSYHVHTNNNLEQVTANGLKLDNHNFFSTQLGFNRSNLDSPADPFSGINFASSIENILSSLSSPSPFYFELHSKYFVPLVRHLLYFNISLENFAATSSQLPIEYFLDRKIHRPGFDPFELQSPIHNHLSAELKFKLGMGWRLFGYGGVHHFSQDFFGENQQTRWTQSFGLGLELMNQVLRTEPARITVGKFDRHWGIQSQASFTF